MKIRSFLRNSFVSTMSHFSKPKNGVYILNGHFINPHQSFGKNKFIHQLSLLRNNYEFINIEDAVRLIKEGENAVGNARAIAFTFDDGFFDCVDSIAPALDSFDVNACFFINSGFIDSDDSYQKAFTEDRVNTPGKKPMSWRDVKLLADNGHLIGNHTKDHFRLSELNFNEFKSQVMLSHNKIESELGMACEYFAWPYGQLEDIIVDQIDFLSNIYSSIFSGAQYRNYFSYDSSAYNRRHFEPCWPASHVKYFLSKGRVFNRI